MGHQDLPRARDLRRHPLDRRGVRQDHREPVPGARLRDLRRRERPPPRHVHRPLRPGRGPHRGSHQPLQHDVQSLLHGRQPGWLRPRAELGGDREDPRRRITVKPRRQMSVQFSGGEPTMSPHFLDAVRYRRRSATTRSRPPPTAFASPRSPSSPAGEGGGPAHGLPPVRRRRQRGQLPPQGRQPVRRARAGHRKPRTRRGSTSSSVVTIVNGVNNNQVGPIVDFAIENPDKITRGLPARLLHGPGRGDQRRATRRKQRYTLRHLAHDLKKQLRRQDRALAGLVSRSALHGRSPTWPTSCRGQQCRLGLSMKCGCHPNCGSAPCCSSTSRPASGRRSRRSSTWTVLSRT